MEDINNILNTGEVPNLMALEDLEEIITDMRVIVKERGLYDTRDVMLKLFTQLVRENLHIVLTFSPVGEKLRNRCRQVFSNKILVPEHNKLLHYRLVHEMAGRGSLFGFAEGVQCERAPGNRGVQRDSGLA